MICTGDKSKCQFVSQRPYSFKQLKDETKQVDESNKWAVLDFIPFEAMKTKYKLFFIIFLNCNNIVTQCYFTSNIGFF